MTAEKPTSSMQDRMAELKESLEKEKVTLTPEVEGYIRECVRAVQDKLQNGDDVYEEDLAFIEQVKLWVSMPKQWREKYVSIEEMRSCDERTEASERGISLKQWLDVLHVAEAKGESKEWIDKTFSFPGGGRIEAEGGLALTGCTSLTSLPEGLTVGGNLDLDGCTSLTSLPGGLTVGWTLNLFGCTSLTRLPEGLAVGASLDLGGCTSLTRLPEELTVEGSLSLNGCTSLTSLPEALTVGWNLYLSENLHEQVKEDAKRLKEERKIRGKINYE